MLKHLAESYKEMCSAKRSIAFMSASNLRSPSTGNASCRATFAEFSRR